MQSGRGNPRLPLFSQWESSHQQRETATAKRSPTRPPPTVGGGATGLTPTVPSLPPKLSMLHAATNTASRCDTLISVRELSNRASTPRLPSVFTGSELVSTSMFQALAQTREAATDFGLAYTRQSDWTRSQCAGNLTGVCASRRSGSGLACEPEGATIRVPATSGKKYKRSSGAVAGRR
jgi:hypothetical protein